MNRPTVGVILVNWNGISHTLKCLHSLFTINNKEVLAVLVVDNGSKDSTEIQRIQEAFPQVETIVNKENHGYTGANNQGFLWAKKKGVDYILVLNNDTTVTENFLEVLLESIRDRTKLIVAPKTLVPDTDTVYNTGLCFSIWHGGSWNWNRNRRSEDYTDLYYPNYLSGCCWLMPLAALNDVGSFDDRFFAYYEDTDFSWRAKKAGYQLMVNGKSVIYHRRYKMTPENYFRLFYLSRNLIYLLKRHGYPFFSILVAWLIFCLGWLKRKPHWSVAKTIFQGLFAAISDDSALGAARGIN